MFTDLSREIENSHLSNLTRLLFPNVSEQNILLQLFSEIGDLFPDENCLINISTQTGVRKFDINFTWSIYKGCISHEWFMSLIFTSYCLKVTKKIQTKL